MVVCRDCSHWDKLPTAPDEGVCKMAMEVYLKRKQGMRATNNGCLVTKSTFGCILGDERDETNAEGT